MYHWTWSQIPQYFPLFLAAAGRTLLISGWSIVGGTVLGVVVGLLRVMPSRTARALAVTYVEVMRNVPLMLILYMVYFGLGYIVQLPPLWAGVVSLSLFEAAYVAEILRAGLESIEKGQGEAAQALGMTWTQTMRHVLLPQTFRRILPPLTGQFVSLIKDSSLASLVSYQELMLVGRQVNSAIFRPFEVFLTIGLLYFLLCFGLSLYSRHLEKRLMRSDQR